MGWIQLAVLIFQFIFKVWDTIKEHNDEIKKKRTKSLQSGLRGIIDKDASRITKSFDDLNKI